ncbi:MAG TPA: hypothetical protein PLT00_06230 [Verrucomicrobiota bacterium]|jgi:hypothetical protein|nr:hypothetical protein [Verrucomicrobiota bacterium]HPY29797.1 hypothetical protein [Verrucomicrobiota bacterium]HQB16294.1 hypothetical protein [Verrucomicrobiota bacterium]
MKTDRSTECPENQGDAYLDANPENWLKKAKIAENQGDTYLSTCPQAPKRGGKA